MAKSRGKRYEENIDGGSRFLSDGVIYGLRLAEPGTWKGAPRSPHDCCTGMDRSE